MRTYLLQNPACFNSRRVQCVQPAIQVCFSCERTAVLPPWCCLLWILCYFTSTLGEQMVDHKRQDVGWGKLWQCGCNASRFAHVFPVIAQMKRLGSAVTWTSVPWLAIKQPQQTSLCAPFVFHSRCWLELGSFNSLALGRVNLEVTFNISERGKNTCLGLLTFCFQSNAPRWCDLDWDCCLGVMVEGLTFPNAIFLINSSSQNFTTLRPITAWWVFLGCVCWDFSAPPKMLTP